MLTLVAGCGPDNGNVTVNGNDAAPGGAFARPTEPEEETMANSPMPNKDYDLVSVIYHCCQGVETGTQYAADAKKAGDKEAEAFFKECCEMNARMAALEPMQLDKVLFRIPVDPAFETGLDWA